MTQLPGPIQPPPTTRVVSGLWHHWFAWHPVVANTEKGTGVNHLKLAWLVTVKRRMNVLQKLTLGLPAKIRELDSWWEYKL